MKCSKWMVVGLGLLSAIACNGLKVVPAGTGRVVITVETLAQGASTRAVLAQAFTLQVLDAAQQVIKEATVEELEAVEWELEEGTYYVKVFNREFTQAAFGTPLYEDQATVQVTAGQTCTVSLLCTLSNAGIRVVFEPNFVARYPQYAMQVAAAGANTSYGALEFNAQTQGQWGYFPTGEVTLSLRNGTEPLGSTTRRVAPQSMSTFVVSKGSEISQRVVPQFVITVDTSGNYQTSIWNMDGVTKDRAYTVPQARYFAAQNEGETIWVTGYIVGCIKNNKLITEVSDSTAVDSNVAIAFAAQETNVDACFSVGLRTTDMKNTFGLKGHPEKMGTQVWVKGPTRSKYLGQPGIESTSEME